MKNAYDIRYEKNLIYIMPEYDEGQGPLPDGVYSRTAIILYLYYTDTLSAYYRYLDGIPFGIDVYVLSSRKEVLEKIRAHADGTGRKRIYFIRKKNRGRDVSALLVTSAEIAEKYTYVCFVHDKKEHSIEQKADTDLWVENLWGNLLGSAGYIDNILRKLEETDRLGVLAPPEPIGEHFGTWYGYAWYKSFGITKRIADEMGLHADIQEGKPPITLGTALWFKSHALRKLLKAGWDYGDFDDDRLADPNYLSYGIERIFAYVAQDAGYDTGTTMTVPYAMKQMNYLQYTTRWILSEAKPFFPFFCAVDIKRYKQNTERITEFVRENQVVYLYGAGEYGRFCFCLLKAGGFSPVGYIVSDKQEEETVMGLPVFLIQEIENGSCLSVIITVRDPEGQREIIKRLREKKIWNYIMFWY